jgi:putative transposase
VQNAFAESFIGRFRDELFTETLFRSLPHARAIKSSGNVKANEKALNAASELGLRAPQGPTAAQKQDTIGWRSVSVR